MRSKFLILLVLLVLNITFTNISGQDDIRIHELHEQTPIFEGLNDTGTFDEGSYVYELYSVIEIKYKADRFNVDGVLILGTGSGLIDDITHENISDYEIPKVRSFRNESFYTFELNITSFTSFYGYAYYGSYENGTAEEFELFDNSNRHQLWINGEMSTPSFSGTNATEAGSNQFGDYYAPLNSVVTINYTAITGNDTVFDLFISAGQ
ncbi:MAG: hypothetical protein OEZ01_17420, partial [Candidatus Heimdallarchaeota archaeon]|nr:hypothetical protein [Candidatus Heimdallarchaeota archaeon]